MNDSLRGKRCAIYARYSSDRQREASIEDQVRRCRKFIQDQDGMVADEMIFCDHAISGASMLRPAFGALLSLVSSKPKKVDVVVTEDVSRLNRDFADAAYLFKVTQFAQVRILGLADGVDTDGQSAMLLYGFNAMMADAYRAGLADKTRRGLEGRVLNGYSAGGLAFGYVSTADTAADGRVVGFRMAVDPDSAMVVRQIFDLYLAGRSLAAIAHQLNAEMVPPPRARTAHRRKGWVASTIRAMLHNQRYAGVWTFGERKWVRVPGTNNRRPQRRDAADVIRQERPELRIIEPATWQAVQARLAGVMAKYTRDVDGKPKGRAGPGRQNRYLLSGLLLCGECGSPLIITGTPQSGLTYRCSDHLKRGTCGSRVAVKEDAARESIVKKVLAMLGKPDRAAYLLERVDKRLKEVGAQKDLSRDRRRRRLLDLEVQIANLVGFLSDGNASPAVAVRLGELEAELVRERQKVDTVEDLGLLQGLPSPKEVSSHVRGLKKVLAGDPIRGREALRNRFAGGCLKVMADENGDWVAKGELVPLEFFMGSKGLKTKTAPEGAVSCDGSGGAVCVDETSKVPVYIDLWFDLPLRAAA